MATENSTPKPYGFIYLITNLVNGKMYVGQTTQSIETRWYQHCHDANRIVKYAIRNAIHKYGPANFSMVAVAEAFSQTELDEKESELVAAYRSGDRQFGYNIRAGGNGGGKLSAETRKKLSDHMVGKPAPNKGRPMPEHQKQAMKALRARWTETGTHPRLGIPCSEETKAKIAASNRGIRIGTKASDGTKSKMSETHKRLLAEMTPEQRTQRSAHLKGLSRTADVRQKIGNAHRGKALSGQHREKLRVANLGKVMSQKTRQKISETLKGKSTHAWTAESRKRASESAKAKGSPSVETRQRLSDKAKLQWARFRQMREANL